MSLGKLNSDHTFRWWCPGCDCMHVVPVAGTLGWGFSGDCERPTLSPSVLVYSHRTLIDDSLEGNALTAPDNVRETPRCHSFVRDGMIQYLGDCSHALAGQTVPMEPLSE